jgi:hypothetical protein
LTPFPVQSVLIPPYTHELPKLFFAAARGYRFRGFERVRRRREEGRHEGNVDRFFSRFRRRFLLPMLVAAFARNTPRKKEKSY